MISVPSRRTNSKQKDAPEAITASGAILLVEEEAVNRQENEGGELLRVESAAADCLGGMYDKDKYSDLKRCLNNSDQTAENTVGG